MTEQSSQHGQRIDDEMSSEVEGLVRGVPVGTRAREDLDPEAPETAAVAIDPIDDERHEEVLQRSELARFLRPSAFPADAATLLAVARDEEATELVLSELGRLPREVEFPTVAAIWEALGHETEHRDTVGLPASAAKRTPEVAAASREVALDQEAESSPSPGPTVLAIGVGLVRGALHIADRTLAALQDRLTR